MDSLPTTPIAFPAIWSHTVVVRSSNFGDASISSTYDVSPPIQPSHWGMDINVKSSHSFSPMPLSLSLQSIVPAPRVSASPFRSTEQQLGRATPNYAWQINLDPGNAGENGGQASDNHNMLGFFGPLQGDCLVGVIPNFFSHGECSGGVDEGNIFGNVSFPLY
ncbi:hypothetical protein ACP70R_037835 [Stipagrostis hirtigluma subsp. patula]